MFTLKKIKINYQFKSLTPYLKINHFTTEGLSNFVPKIDEDKLDKDDLEFLKEKNLKIHSDSDMMITIKILLRENKDLINQNNRLEYRIEHMLKTIGNLEKKNKE